MNQVSSAVIEPIVFNENLSNISIDSSNSITEIKEPIRPRDPRAIRLERFLRNQNSQLSYHPDLIVELSDIYGIDYRMVVAIAGVESGYCRVNFKSNNCWGYGKYSWPTLEIGIVEYYRLLNKNYISRGLNTIQKIAPIYAPNSPSTYIEKYYLHFNKIPL